MTDIKSMTLEELRQALTGLGEKPFRAKQLYEWIHRKLAVSYDEMTNLSKHLREKLEKEYPLTVRSDLSYTEAVSGTCLQCGGDGDGRAFGQL